MGRISVEQGDVRKVAADIVVLKFATVNRGADLAIARALGDRSLAAALGSHTLVRTDGKITAPEVLSIGVGALSEFDYPKISEFVRTAIKLISDMRPGARRVAITLHGPGYGLDELGSIHALFDGAASAIKSASFDLVIVELDIVRAKRIEAYLSGQTSRPRLAGENAPIVSDRDLADRLSDGGGYRKRIFTAMPFAKRYLDHWEFALQPAGHELNLLMERLDHEYFTGDILNEIRSRIENASAVIALLDDSNPNVFLEVGYAWAKGKPTVLVLHNSQQPPFDVQGQRLLRYERLGELRDSLIAWLRELELQRAY